jgi:hypothetical protein
VDCGTEIRLFDPRRNPRDRTDLIHPTQCAVFLKNGLTSAPLFSSGVACADPSDATCILFGSVAHAQQFCEGRIQALTNLRCKITMRTGWPARRSS